MKKDSIHSPHAPRAMGAYSQAIKSGNIVFLSGQIPLDPSTMNLVSDDIRTQTTQVFSNLQAVCLAAESNLDAIVKLTIYLTDLAHFPIINEVMATFFKEPYPARTTIQVVALPKSAQIEIDAIIVN